MFNSLKALKSLIIGKTLGNAEQDAQRFSITWGLPVLSSDAISSVAYACEEILLVLIPAIGIASYSPMLGAAAVIIALLFILVFCYRQTIDAYPQGGGAYSVARENLGRAPSLVAGASLIIDYVLTIAVSACSGTAAIVSAFSQLLPYKVELTVFFIVLLTIGNLRGIKESSVLFGLPTYFFIISVLVMIVTGIGKALFFGAAVDPITTLSQPAQDLTLFLFLRAFSSGCSALTGVEAVSNSVPNFREPAQKNAKLTLALLGCIVFVIFGGVCVLAMLYRVAPQDNVTVVAQIATAVFGGGSVMFYVIQAATAIILLLAANTAYNGLPQLMSLLAKDGFIPRRFGNRGTRLVFSSGIIFAAMLSVLLVIGFKADVHLLIPLYSVGVFLSFTIAQSGMLKHWLENKTDNWRHKAFINGFGAIVTGIVCAIITITKFVYGAWIVLVAIALLVWLMQCIRHHYDRVADNLRIAESARELIFVEVPQNHVIIPVQSVNKSFIKALNYALGLSGSIEIYHVGSSETQIKKLKKQYTQLGIDAPLVIEKTEYRNVNEVLLKHVDQRQAELAAHETLTVVMPRLITKKWWHYALHNQTSLFLESALLGRRNVAVVAIPYIIEE